MLETMKEKVSSALKMEISNFADYGDGGFSFTVETELLAYKAAYIYRYSKEVVVKYAPNVQKWLVSIYRQS